MAQFLFSVMGAFAEFDRGIKATSPPRPKEKWSGSVFRY